MLSSIELNTGLKLRAFVPYLLAILEFEDTS
jgi:hypothetical protein